MAGKLQEVWEAQLGSTVLWAPVALTFGIWTYFALPQEPALPLTGFFMLLAVVLFWKAQARMGMLLLAIFSVDLYWRNSALKSLQHHC